MPQGTNFSGLLKPPPQPPTERREMSIGHVRAKHLGARLRTEVVSGIVWPQQREKELREVVRRCVRAVGSVCRSGLPDRVRSAIHSITNGHSRVVRIGPHKVGGSHSEWIKNRVAKMVIERLV